MKEILAMSSLTYPVHVDAQLDTDVSRGLWLIKWLLALPHYVVLAFLWIAFAVLSVVAFFAILITGRYPRTIFAFNVGVLRWHWRVAYYSYGALGTDRYPPFTLHDVAEYPAHLEVDYPEHLSRGLVLVKWWLLALPHYLIVALLLGGAGYYAGTSTDQSGLWGTGLIPLLVIVAAVIMLFTGRYPQSLFDLVLGLNRWVLRVAGYAALMTDTYPPFRLDQGGHEGGTTGTVVVGQETAGKTAPAANETPPGLPPPSGPAGARWTAGRTVSVVVGCTLALGSLGLGIPASALLVANQTARDDAGFVMTPEQTLTSQTYAITSEDLEMRVDAPPDLTPGALIGDAKLTAEASDGGDVFIGIGSAADVSAFVKKFEHDTVLEITGGRPVMRTTQGGVPMGRPASAGLWVAQASGPGDQELTWSPENGDWAVVVMNADATRGVDVAMTAGAEVPALSWVIGILFALAGAGLVLAICLIVLPLRAASREANRQPWSGGSNVPGDE